MLKYEKNYMVLDLTYLGELRSIPTTLTDLPTRKLLEGFFDKSTEKVKIDILNYDIEVIFKVANNVTYKYKVNKLVDNNALLCEYGDKLLKIIISTANPLISSVTYEEN